MSKLKNSNKIPANWKRHFARISKLPKPIKKITTKELLELVRV